MSALPRREAHPRLLAAVLSLATALLTLVAPPLAGASDHRTPAPHPAKGPSVRVADARDLRAGPVAFTDPLASAATLRTLADNRVRVTNTKVFPASAVGQIEVVNDLGERGYCSGFLIDVNIVATSAHCLHGGIGRGYNRGSTFYPARNGAALPFGSCGGGAVWVPRGWITTEATAARERYDYGVYKMPASCSTIGNKTGWFRLRVAVGSLTGQSSTNHGYPGDKTFGTQWRSSDTVRATTTTQLFYGNDTAGGMSGGPVFNSAGSCVTCVIAIHGYGLGHHTGPHQQYNHGTRITQAVFDFLTKPR